MKRAFTAILILFIASASWAGFGMQVIGTVNEEGTFELHTDYTSDANCVGAWSFEQDRSDSSGNSQTLSASGDAYSNSFSKWGSYSVLFTDDKLYRNNSNLSASFPGKTSYEATAMSVCVWIKPTQVGEIQQIVAVTDEGGNYYRSWSLCIQENNTILYQINDSTHNEHNKTSTTVVSSGTEYHIVGTWDGSNIRLYINGSAEGSPVENTSIDTACTGPLIVGKWATLFDFAGYIDELAVFNDCLSSDEVSEIYSHGLAGQR